jgi:hypothetical protein
MAASAQANEVKATERYQFFGAITGFSWNVPHFRTQND